jgi:Leucine-rich repeat (LRR) protein
VVALKMWYIWDLLLLLCVLHIVCSQTSTDVALCGFIAATNIHSLSEYSQWSCSASGITDSDPCSAPVWLGLTCSGSSVSQLSVNAVSGIGGGLTGSIPSSLSQLTGLSVLSLSGNQLSGTIPGALENLSNLRTLQLNGNSLFGNIPHELGVLTALSHINIAQNDLNGSIPSGVQLVSLNALYLSENKLTGKSQRSVRVPCLYAAVPIAYIHSASVSA